MFTRKRFLLPRQTGNDREDIRALGKAIHDYLLSVEQPDSLEIDAIKIRLRSGPDAIRVNENPYGIGVFNYGGFDSTVALYANSSYAGAAAALGGYDGTTFNARLTALPDGRVFGTALHDNSNAITGTTNQYIASKTYTPTVSNAANVSSSTARLARAIRVGNVVHVAGEIDITPSAGAAFSFELSLPIASNFVNAFECSGTVGPDNIAINGSIRGSTANDTAVVSCANTTTGSHTLTYTYSYLIL